MLSNLSIRLRGLQHYVMILAKVRESLATADLSDECRDDLQRFNLSLRAHSHQVEDLWISDIGL